MFTLSYWRRTTMAESQSFSESVDRLLQAIRPYGQARVCFPRSLNGADCRRDEGESLQQWFVRMVDQYCQGDPNLVALEDNIAVFVRTEWRGRTQLRYANIQSVIATCDLDGYYLGENATAIYLRLDFDYKTLGDPFSHPLAHIHVDGDLSPRFALDGGACGNIVVDYLEFLYRNYVPLKWLRWVRREWSKQFAEIPAQDAVDPLPAIVAAFASSQFEILRDYSTQIDRIKRMLRRKKDELFNLHMVGEDRIILEYPLAR